MAGKMMEERVSTRKNDTNSSWITQKGRQNTIGEARFISAQMFLKNIRKGSAHMFDKINMSYQNSNTRPIELTEQIVKKKNENSLFLLKNYQFITDFVLVVLRFIASLSQNSVRKIEVLLNDKVMYRLVKQNTKCPKCRSSSIEKIKPELYMPVYPNSQLYHCKNCGYYYLAIGSHIVKLFRQKESQKHKDSYLN